MAFMVQVANHCYKESYKNYSTICHESTEIKENICDMAYQCAYYSGFSRKTEPKGWRYVNI